ncbi:helix-turn-helix domain-containing protein [Paucilactobacillus wasatchensis]|uniref:Transcriptional regulator, XRE family n=1 Tax=Paucilactobacillus wasatchensis TaxID=1335616 RepID=A0A0D1A7H8_9LACO|nr:helix-turn-helix transcriptional regulator [Paucilactobacillus wasatchensis]KIS03835.1 Transcriptional regulator, XRE family [Paucilactobacillus wasatchensis]
MKIGKQIQTYREQRGLSQNELADKLHISRQSISKWEGGVSLPTFANVVAISNLFNISIDDLVRGDMSLMNSLTANNKEPLSRVFKIIAGGFILGFAIYFVLLGIGIKESTFVDWSSLPAFILFIWLLFTINWRQLNRSMSSKTVILGILFLALILVPNIFDSISAMINASVDAVKGYQEGYHSFK